MIGLAAAKAVGLLKTGPQRSSETVEKDDMESEIFNLLPSSRKVKYQTSRRQKLGDVVNIGPKCSAFVLFLVMMTFSGVVLLVAMAATEGFEKKALNAEFQPISQVKLVHDEAVSEAVAAESYRDSFLPRSLIPQRYGMRFEVSGQSDDYAGDVNITIRCERDTDRIVIHSDGHQLSGAHITDEKFVNAINVSRIGRDSTNGIAIFHLAENLTAGSTYFLGIRFRGSISDEPKGLYRVALHSANGRLSYLVLTNLKPTYAKRLFPCFDEPDLRAKFQLTIIHSDKLKVVTSMPVTKFIRLANGMVESYFQETKLMPTYLLSIVIGDLKEEMTLTRQGIAIQAHANSDDRVLKNLTESVFQAGITALEQATGNAFPLPKLDIVFLPEAAKGGGLGVMILPEIDVRTSPSEKFRFLEIASEKIARIWFEEFVGIKRWTDYWLVTGLSIYASHYKIIGKLEPKLNMNQFFYMKYTQPALKRGQDKMVAFSPTLPFGGEIERRLGAGYRDKAAAIIRMLHSFVGERVFKNCTEKFVSEYNQNGATAHEFFTMMPEVAKLRASLTQSFVKQPGYPVVHLKYSGKKQRLYIFESSILETNTAKHSRALWRFPVRFRVSFERQKKRIFLKKRKLSIHMKSRITWLKANIWQTGLYRVKYSRQLWNGLLKVLSTNHKMLSEIDRAGLIDDAFSLARNGISSYEAAFAITPYLRKEHSYLVWEVAVEHFSYVLKNFHRHRHIDCLRNYLFKLVKNFIDATGWSNTGSLMLRALRPKILEFAVLIGDKKTINQCKQLLFRINTSAKDYNLPSSLKRLIFRTSIRNGGEREWRIVKSFAAPSTKEIKLVFSSLASSKSVLRIKRLLDEMPFSDKRFLDTLVLVLKEISLRPEISSFTWTLVTGYWNKMTINKAMEEEFLVILVNWIRTADSRGSLIKAKEFFQRMPDDKSTHLLVQMTEERLKELKSFKKNFHDIISTIEKLSGRAC